MNLTIVLFCILLCLVKVSYCEQYEYPAPNGKSNRILSMVVAYTLSRMDPLLLTMRGHQAMCESGWDVQFTIFTAQKVSPRMRSYLESKLYCNRIETHVPLVISEHDPSVKNNLIVEMKVLMKRVSENFDLFIYMEEDVVVDLSHVSSYLAENKKLDSLLGKEEARAYYVGFQRYRRHLLPMERMRNHMTESEVIKQEYLEEIPFFKPVCLKDRPYMLATGVRRVSVANVYQAMWMLTKEQVQHLQSTCAYLDQGIPPKAPYVREYLGSLSLLDNDIVTPHCGLKKIIPAGRLLDFGVWHYYHSTHSELLFDSHPLFATHEHIQAGLLQTSEFVAYAGYFDNLTCWAPIVLKQRTAMELSNHLNTESVAVLQAGREILTLKNGIKHHVTDMDTLEKYGLDKLPRHHAKHPMFDALPVGEDLK